MAINRIVTKNELILENLSMFRHKIENKTRPLKIIRASEWPETKVSKELAIPEK